MDRYVAYEQDSRWKYFVRFAQHSPRRSIAGAFDRDQAFCFATEADANHVVEQLRNYGWRARVVPESRKPPPQAPVAPTVSKPPERIVTWVEGIIAFADESGKGISIDQISIDQIQAGYRRLASWFHPDVTGGDDTDMQHLNEARDWLRKHHREDCDVPF
jgi:hypothetical protein